MRGLGTKTWDANTWAAKAGGRDRAGKQREVERHHLRSTIAVSFKQKARFRSPTWVPQTAEVAVRQRGLRKARPTPAFSLRLTRSRILLRGAAQTLTDAHAALTAFQRSR